MVRHDALWRAMVRHDALWRAMVRHDALWRAMVRHDALSFYACWSCTRTPYFSCFFHENEPSNSLVPLWEKHFEVRFVLNLFLIFRIFKLDVLIKLFL